MSKAKSPSTGRRDWHAASSTSPMSHIAIVQPLEGERVNWMEKVTNEEFNGE